MTLSLYKRTYYRHDTMIISYLFFFFITDTPWTIEFRSFYILLD